MSLEQFCEFVCLKYHEGQPDLFKDFLLTIVTMLKDSGVLKDGTVDARNRF